MIWRRDELAIDDEVVLAALFALLLLQERITQHIELQELFLYLVLQ